MGRSHHHHKHHDGGPEDDLEGSERVNSNRRGKMIKIGAVVVLAVIAIAIIVVLQGGTGDGDDNGSDLDGRGGDDVEGGFGNDDEDADDSYSSDEAVVTNPPVPPTRSPTPAPVAPTMSPTPRTTNGPGNDPLGRDPAPPYAKLAKNNEGDPYEGMPVSWSKDGIVFDWSKSATNVRPASPLLGGDAPLDSIIPGRAFTPEGKPLIEYHPGNSPFILICIHTETTPWSKYMANWASSRRACDSSDCRDDLATKNWQKITDQEWATKSQKDIINLIMRKVNNGITNNKKKFKLVEGDASGPSCVQIREYIMEKTDGQMVPHLIYTNIPKGFLDMNRHPRKWLWPRGKLRKKLGLMDKQNPELIASYDDFLGFVREAKNIVARQYGYGWTFNFHSQGSQKNRCDIGTGYQKELKEVWRNRNAMVSKWQPHHDREPTKNDPRGSMLLLHDSPARGMTVFESIYGYSSVSEIIGMRGIGTAPSRAHMFPHGRKEDCFCSGSSFTNRIGMPSLGWAKHRKQRMDNKEIHGRPVEDWYVGNFNNAIVEMYGRHADNGPRQKKFVQVWGESLIDLATDHYGLPIKRTSPRVFWDIKQEYEATIGPAKCKGNKISEIKKKDQQEVYTKKECVDECKKISGCKFVEMGVHNEKNRYCAFYSTCNTQEERYTYVVDLEKLEAAA